MILSKEGSKVSSSLGSDFTLKSESESSNNPAILKLSAHVQYMGGPWWACLIAGGVSANSN